MGVKDNLISKVEYVEYIISYKLNGWIDKWSIDETCIRAYMYNIHICPYTLYISFFKMPYNITFVVTLNKFMQT